MLRTKSSRPGTISAIAIALFLAARLAVGDDWSEERDRAAATARRIELEWPIAGSGPTTHYVKELGAALGRATSRPRARWRFTVVRDRSPNAFAIGDGRIYVTEGVIGACRNEAEVAAILAHEMGHELAGHLRPEREEGGFFGRLFAGREADAKSVGSVMVALEPEKELEADRLSISILERAGYDAYAALSLAERLAGYGDRGRRHFGDSARLANLRDLLADVPRSGRLDSSAFRELKESLGER